MPVDAVPLPTELFDAAGFKKQLDEGQAIPAGKAALAGASDFLHAQFRRDVPTSKLLGLRAAADPRI